MTELIAGFLIASLSFAAGWLYSNKQNAKLIEYNKILANALQREKRANAQYYGERASRLAGDTA